MECPVSVAPFLLTNRTARERYSIVLAATRQQPCTPAISTSEFDVWNDDLAVHPVEITNNRKGVQHVVTVEHIMPVRGEHVAERKLQANTPSEQFCLSTIPRSVARPCLQALKFQ